MEDIYHDLNNYEDVNAVEELRSENKELKVKLEEHSAALEKLQREILQDYDKLETEFKKLENNYSSLLKTARSEIERQTKRITQLNLEKDVMILEALKKGQSIRRHFNKGVPNQNKANNEKPNLPDQRKETKSKECDAKQKYSGKTERCEPTAKDAKDLITDANNRDRLESAGAREELCTSRNSNVIHKKTEVNEMPTMRANSIRDRRKSMPAASMPVEQFSSDEENKQNYHAKDRRPDHPLLDRDDRRNSYKLSVDRHSNKISETSSIEDRGYNYYETSSRDYKGRPSRNTASSSHRGRDKYELSLKHRKQYSPDRGAMKRKYREYQDDYQKYERGRYQGRSLESPPPEPYRNVRRNPDPRSWSDSRHVHDYDKYAHRHDDKYSSKSKLSMDYDEPQSKRLRKESRYAQPDALSREDRRYNNEIESMEVYHTPEFSPHEYDMHHYSCQSPDLVHTDEVLTEPIEIKTTTTSTPIQDPRLTDSKYIKKQENGKKTITSTVGRSIDLMPVDKSKWNNFPVDIPLALVQRPPEYRDEIVKEIYMNIDSPNADASSATESFPYNSNDVCDENLHGTKDFSLRREEPDITSKRATDAPLKDPQPMNKYRIPKLGQEKINTRIKMDVPIIDLGVIEPKMPNIHNKVGTGTDIRKESISSQDPRHRRDDVHRTHRHRDAMKDKTGIQNQKANIAIVADDLELSDDNSDHLDTSSHTVPEKNQRNSAAQLNTKDVRGEVPVHKVDKDSAKTSSNSNTGELHNTRQVKNKEADYRKQKSKLNSKEIKCEDSVHKIEKDSSKKSPSFDAIELKDGKENKSKETDCAGKHERKLNFKDVKCEDSVHKTAKDPSQSSSSFDTVREVDEVRNKEVDSTRKHKSKKKKSKSKEIPKDSTECTDAIEVSEKKAKTKKEKESKPKETKETFSALFGDSSSLMTPEDLGIPSYVPISEDAQDAVDIKIDQIIDAPQLDKELPVIIHKENTVEFTKEETIAHNDKSTDVRQNCNIKEKEVFKETTKKAPKRKEQIVDPNELPSPVLYENMNPGTDSNEPPDVVKTVVISTGKQPEIELDNRELTVTPIAGVEGNEEQTAADLSQVPALKEFKRLDTLKALATSTPQKDFPTLNPMETEVINTNSNKPVEQEVKENGGNTVETQDAPDVRIFVKRRRKLAKRPPMT